MIKNKKITRNISQGMYVLTTDGAGCMVDAVSQVSASDKPLISVAVNKNNYTNEMIKKNKKFGLSVLDMDVDGEIIERFGMHSSRDIDKFEGTDTENIDGIKGIKDSIGYMVFEVVDIIDTDTHNLFIGKMIAADKYNDKKEMTYAYYQEHKGDLIKVKTDTGRIAWICTICGYVYYGEEIPDDFKCPVCGVSKDMFKKVDN